MERSAVLSHCGRYRYSLSRRWDNGVRGPATFIMLNPSTADAERDDPTIRRCMGFARTIGCVGMHVVNLFAMRATRPLDMKAALDPVGPDNLEHVIRAVDARKHHHGLVQGPLICAWGTHGGYMDQDQTVMGLMGSCAPCCLGMTKHGFPKHPLYVRRDVELRPYPGRFANPSAVLPRVERESTLPSASGLERRFAESVRSWGT